MSIPKAAGIETEYGIFVWGSSTAGAFTASQLVLDAYRAAGGGPAVPEVLVADADPDDPDDDAAAAPAPGGDAQQAVYSLGSLMLANGARFYIDHTHPEYSTPESLDPLTVTAADKAGERIIGRCVDLANQSGVLPDGQRLAIYKNNSDGHGSSYGCHENYLLSAALFDDLLRRRSHLIFRYLLPFLVSRVVFCGAGKVGSENKTPPTPFQLSQRADFFEALIGLQTTYQRPLFNTRDEPHADPALFRRLHVIPGDANLSETATYLKIGTLQLVLSLIEDGALRDDLTLAIPLDAFQQVSRDLTLRQPLQLEDGRQLSALDLQEIYLARVEHYLDERGGTDVQWAVWERWADVLDALRRGDRAVLARQLDWAIKQRVLERYLDNQGVTWDEVNAWQPVIAVAATNALAATNATAQALAAEAGLRWADYERQREVYFALRRLDLDYHAVRGADGGAGLFARLQAGGHVDRLLDDATIERLIQAPPDDTRAWLRGKIIERFSSQVISVDWSSVQLRGSDPAHPALYQLSLPDPLVGTARDLAAVWDRLHTPAELFALFVREAGG